MGSQVSCRTSQEANAIIQVRGGGFHQDSSGGNSEKGSNSVCILKVGLIESAVGL